MIRTPTARRHTDQRLLVHLLGHVEVTVICTERTQQARVHHQAEQPALLHCRPSDAR